MQTTESIEGLVDSFDRSLMRRSRSPNTVRAYRWALDDFLRYLRPLGVVRPADLKQGHLDGWIDSRRRLSPQSRALAITSLRQLLKWLAANAYVEYTLYLSVEPGQFRQGIPRPLEEVQVQAILAYYGALKNPTLGDLRDYSLFTTLVGTGARISELLQLNRRDLKSDLLVWQKGRRERRLVLPGSASALIRRYLAGRTDSEPAVWITLDTNRPTRRLTAIATRDIWKRLAAKIGIEPFTTHQLRHTAATLLYEAGVPESVIAEQMGHRSLEGLRNYIQIRNSKLQQAMDAMDVYLSEAMASTPEDAAPA